MEHIHITPRASHARQPAVSTHSTSREGVRLGLIIGAATWLWVAGFDYARGEPFYTIDYLGGFAKFTLVHFSLCIAYGLALMSAVHASMKEPTVMFALIFSTILFQAAIVAATGLLENIGVGRRAWAQFLIGNIIATGVALFVISRDHSLLELYHAAENGQKD
jgi:hypothetical protein